LVRDNPEQNRFELETDAGLAVADYSRDGDLLIIFHTDVPVAIHGQSVWDDARNGELSLFPAFANMNSDPSRATKVSRAQANGKSHSNK
jgi:hypothetical protein